MNGNLIFIGVIFIFMGVYLFSSIFLQRIIRRIYDRRKFKKYFGSTPAREEPVLHILHYHEIVRPILKTLAFNLNRVNEEEAAFLDRIKKRAVKYKESIKKLDEIRKVQSKHLDFFIQALELAQKFDYVDEHNNSHLNFLGNSK